MGRALAEAKQRIASREEGIAEGEPGFYLQFDIPVDESAAVDALESRRSAIELVAVRPPAEGDTTVSATVFVPERSEQFFAQKIEQYRDEDTRWGKPKHEALIARIETVRLGTAQSLFTDPAGSFPAAGRQVWWEVWLREGRLAELRRVASRLNLQIKDHTIRFPERDVVLVLADQSGISRLLTNTDAVAELRLAKDVPSLFLEMQPVEQVGWVQNVLDRVTPPGRDAPAVCVLDGGAVQAHPLLAPALQPADQHACQPHWGLDDSTGGWRGHGTGMAGVALYGDLEATLTRSTPVVLRHRLETVRILPRRGQNPPELYGAVTETAVAMVESQAPRRPRVFCMAVTSEIGLGRGRPSSWSAAIDQLAYGGGNVRRLFALATGNIREDVRPAEYPDRNDLAEAENPAQAWNALVVGACTDKITITHPDYRGWEPMAPAGCIGPTSRTSGVWDRQWPIRPDVMFEGGNQAHDGSNPGEQIDDLQLLTAHYRPAEGLLRPFGETSAATAMGSRLAARIMAARPDLWPETVRGLIVHAAEWTPAMRRHVEQAGTQAQKMAMLRRYGWGVPTWRRALYSATNDTTLIVEDTLWPFRRDASAIKTRDMNLHRLPWPREELLGLGRQDVELRITLSYFVEPNPGERGWTRRHRYASHGLRFALKRSLETHDQFRRRINRAVEAEEAGQPINGGVDDWVLGPMVRDRGSIHSDIWRGSAAELADRDAVGIVPISGWWKENARLQRWDRSARYALLVSIRALGAEIDLYTAIANKIAVEVPAS